MTTLRRAVVQLVLLGLRVVVGSLSRVVPTTRSVVVSVFPAAEGNGVETAKALVRRYDGQVVWLVEGRVPDEVADLAGLRFVRKASAAGIWAYLRAEAVFFTHGLYGSPRPCPRKPLVNLWHGDGPKRTRPDNDAGSLIPSTFLVGSTELFTGLKGQAFGVPPERLLVTGNPRTDRLWVGVAEASLATLGILGDFVLWMPTFRRTRNVGAVVSWSEAVGTGPKEAESLAPLVEGLRRRGLTLVVKPHPMDAEERRWPGVVTITDDDLATAGVGLYPLLGEARGLVTDYSSVWVDFLLLDRPLAFLADDGPDYSRGLAPADALEWLPGERVGERDQPFEVFLADLDECGRRGAQRRREVARHLGLNQSRTAADDLLDALHTRAGLSLAR